MKKLLVPCNGHQDQVNCRALLPLPTQHNLQVSRTSRRHLTHFFLAGFRRAEGSFGAEEEDAPAAATALGWALAAAPDVFAVTDVEDEFVAFGPSNAFEPVDTADFCKEESGHCHGTQHHKGCDG